MIAKYNLVFDDNVYLKYGVKFDGIEDENVIQQIKKYVFMVACNAYCQVPYRKNQENQCLR